MKKIILLLIISIFLIEIVAGDVSYVFKKGEEADLKISCFDTSYVPCSSTTPCMLTVFYPNSSTFIENKTMTQHGTFYNYSIPGRQTKIVGEYPVIVSCYGSSNGYSTFNFLITPRGKETTIADVFLYLSALAIMIFFLTACMLGFKEYAEPHFKVIFGGFAYVLLTGISYVLWLSTENILFTTTFLSAMFYWMFLILMFAFLPLFLASMVWLVWMAITIAPMRRMLSRGVPEDRATRMMERRRKW